MNQRLRYVIRCTGLKNGEFAARLGLAQESISRKLHEHEPITDSFVGRVHRVLGPAYASSLLENQPKQSINPAERRYRDLLLRAIASINDLRAMPVTEPAFHVLKETRTDLECIVEEIDERLLAE